MSQPTQPPETPAEGQRGLLPCPFCECANILLVEQDNGCFYACEDCGAETDFVDTEREAADRWNRRADKAALEKRVAELEAALSGLSTDDEDEPPCFCEMGIGNPMVSDHSAACKAAREALGNASVDSVQLPTSSIDEDLEGYQSELQCKDQRIAQLEAALTGVINANLGFGSIADATDEELQEAAEKGFAPEIREQANAVIAARAALANDREGAR